jgi:hypothetical protein
VTEINNIDINDVTVLRWFVIVYSGKIKKGECRQAMVRCRSHRTVNFALTAPQNEPPLSVLHLCRKVKAVRGFQPASSFRPCAGKSLI